MSRPIIEKLRRRGHDAYWVGGYVRDRLLGRPVKDHDVATSALPDEVAKIFPDARRQGERFGVLSVLSGDKRIEIATFRKDHQYSDGRRPDQVTYTKHERDDVVRRDFTINGMLLSPGNEEPIDYVGGLDDLRSKLVRAIGDPQERFGEDRLRMLRAVRFAACLGFEIEADTKAAIRQLAAKVKTVAPERVRVELSRILTEGSARRGFELLAECGLLRHLLPEVAALIGVEQPPEFHPEGDVWTHTMLMLGNLRNPSETLAWGVLLHDIGKPGTFRRADRIRFHGHVRLGMELSEELCRRLRFSRAATSRVVGLVANHMKFMDLQRMRPAKLRRFVLQAHFEEHLELHRLDCLASNGRLENYRFAIERFQAAAAEEPLERLLTGHDLKAAGYVPGPLYREIFSAVEASQVEGALATRSDAMQFVRERFPLVR